MTKSDSREQRTKVRAWIVAILSIAIWLMLASNSSDAFADEFGNGVPAFVVAQVLGHGSTADSSAPRSGPGGPRGARGRAAEEESDVSLVADRMQAAFQDQLVAGVSRPSVELEVHFDFDSDRIHDESSDEIAAAAQVLKRHFPDAHFRVAGYTDAAGAADYNQQLSERRAQVVWSMLVEEHGVDAARLDRVGYGENDPAVDASDAERRRVELQIVHLVPSSSL